MKDMVAFYSMATWVYMSPIAQFHQVRTFQGLFQCRLSAPNIVLKENEGG